MNILFVSHAATRGGAPGVLLELLRYCKRETAHEATILCARSGPLEKEFEELAQPFPAPHPYQVASTLGGAARRVREMGWARRAWLERALQVGTRFNDARTRSVASYLPRYDWVYANSAASGDAVRGLEPVLKEGARLFVHVHELAFALERNEPGWTFLKKHGHVFLAASNAVRDELIAGQRLAPERIEVVPEWLDFDRLRTDRAQARGALRGRIGAPDDAVLVGGCGTLEARKGADWWVQSAFYALGTQPNARKTPAPLHFVWLGGKEDAFARNLKRDVRGYGLEGRVHFLSAMSEPQTFFAGLDVFCLSSREDPFPLVCLEAAAQDVPTVCFARSGGAPELVEPNAGVVVPWGDVAGMGRALASLGRDASFREQLGFKARRRALELSDANANCARVVALLERA